jgi:cobalamin synthase
MTAPSLGRGLALYALACVLLIGLSGAVFSAVYRTEGDRMALAVSAVFALVIQVIAYVLARLLATRGNGVAGWTLGAAICLVSLVIYGFVSRAMGLPSNAALLSLATFFFLTELIEPPLLNV